MTENKAGSVTAKRYLCVERSRSVGADKFGLDGALYKLNHILLVQEMNLMPQIRVNTAPKKKEQRHTHKQTHTE